EKPTYEFNDEQNATFHALASYMKVAGFLLVAFGGLQLILVTLVSMNMMAVTRGEGHPFGSLALVQMILSLAITAVYGYMGAWTRKSGHDFQQVVDTHGSDITHLMDALSELRISYNWIYLGLFVSLGLMLIWILFGGFLASSINQI
ncbi:unnamed protein product, partial [Phaeothamnion confervicola]